MKRDLEKVRAMQRRGAERYAARVRERGGRAPLERRKELAPVSARKLEEAEAEFERGFRSRTTFRRKGGFTPASPEQRAKVQKQGCRVTAEHGGHVHPAHVTDRALGGCDDPRCVVGLRADLHRLYDMGAYDLLPHLTFEEQAHAAEHSGLLGALQQTTGQRYAPVEDPRLERDYPASRPLLTHPTNERS